MLRIILLLLVSSPFALTAFSDDRGVRVGWIGAMSGAVAKYGAYQAAILAAEDVNREGGINGKRFELVYQDGKCNSRDAVTAANELISVEKVRFIVGGHCSPESIPMATIAEKSKTIMMAAITSSPKLSALGDYVFRVTAPNTAGAELLIEHVRSKGFPKVAIIYEETEYAQGLGEFFRAEAEKAGISVTYYNSFSPGETDFRSMVTKLRGSGAEALYLSPQSPDGTIGILRALKEQNVSIPVLGNEIAGNTVKAAGGSATFFENMVFAEPEFNSNNTEVKTFEERYKKRFNVPALPYGFYTCEAYDAVRVIAHIIKTCGADADLAKKCLYDLKDYKGLSGRIAFDKNGDGIRRYVLKKIVNGQILQ